MSLSLELELNTNRELRKKVTACVSGTLDDGSERGFFVYHRRSLNTSKIYHGHADVLNVQEKMDFDNSVKYFGSFHTHRETSRLSIMDIGSDIDKNLPANFSSLCNVSEVHNYIPIWIYDYDYETKAIEEFRRDYLDLLDMLDDYEAMTVSTLRNRIKEDEYEEFSKLVMNLKTLRDGGDIFRRIRVCDIRYR